MFIKDGANGVSAIGFSTAMKLCHFLPHLTNINPNSWESLIIVMLENLEIITFCYVPMILSLKGCRCVMLKFIEVIIENSTQFPQLCVPILLKTIVGGGYYLFY